MKNYVDYFRLKRRKDRIRQMPWPAGIRFIDTEYGSIRLLDSGGNKPALFIVPDGPNVIEHYDELIGSLAGDFRVICFELPGFGFSYPALAWDYTFESSNRLLTGLFEALNVPRAILALPCAAGFYALAFAAKYPEKVSRLVMVQTPSWQGMEQWKKRVIPAFLGVPLLGQAVMAGMEGYFARRWYEYALPRGKERAPFREPALAGLKQGACFCLAGMTQGLSQETGAEASLRSEVPATLIYGKQDFTHAHTQFESLAQHVPLQQVIAFDNCGHFPDLEFPRRFAEILKAHA